MRIIVLLIIFSCNVMALYAQHCSSDARYSEKEYFTNEQITSELDLKYATAKDKDGLMQDLHMDVYYPNTNFDTFLVRPLIMLFHGGGFKSGSKEYLRNHCKAFAKRGFVTATVQYRLGEESDSPTEQILRIYRADQDAQAALRWIVANANTFLIDTSWIFVGGVSAGSVMSHNVIYNQQSDWDAIFPLASMQLGQLNTSGNNLTNKYTVKGLYNNCGSAMGSAVKSEEMIPTVSFHKVHDQVVNVDVSLLNGHGSRAMHNWLSSENTCSELTLDTINYPVNDPLSSHCPFTDVQGSLMRINRATCFFKSLFCSSCSSASLNDIEDTKCSVSLSAQEIKSDAITIFPNPTTTDFKILGLPEGTPFEIKNLLGQLIKQSKVGSNNTISQVDKGVYFINIFTKTGMISKKICIK